nr:RHS repeat-associated core domain-containing protein [Pseudidiomarina mangrovi]
MKKTAIYVVRLPCLLNRKNKVRHGTMQASPSATLWNIAGGTPFTMRGFTDHEHIDEAQLIHMNGRVYDYNLGRFLSVDPFIQEPGNSQSLNPYSYIMNNPLAGTDPSGYIADCILAIHCAEQGLQNPFKYPPNCPFCVSVGGGQSEDNGKEQSRAVAKEVGADSIGAPGEFGHNGLRKTPLVDHSSLTPSEVAGDFWDNPNFQSALSQAEREISAEVINESDRKGLLFNPEHANREHGSVIAESDDGTFSYTRPSVDVPSGTINHPSSLRTGFVGGQTAIKNATLVVIGVGPNTRGTTILGNAVNYIELAKELNTPIIVVATWRDRGNLYIFNAKGEYSEVDAKERNKK